jgi:hypothetical protein
VERCLTVAGLGAILVEGGCPRLGMNAQQVGRGGGLAIRTFSARVFREEFVGEPHVLAYCVAIASSVIPIA